MIRERLLLAPALLLAVAAAAPAQDDPALDDDQRALAEIEESVRDPFKAQARRYMDQLEKEYGEDFWTFFFDDGVMPRPYLVAAEMRPNIDREVLEKEYADIFGNLYRVFYAEWGTQFGIEPVDHPVVVLVFEDEDSYKEVREKKPELALEDPEFMAGYFNPNNGQLIQWRQPNLWTVMFHEGTHQLVHFATQQRSKAPQWIESPWFQEGIADFMGGHKRELKYSEEAKGFVTEFKLRQYIDGRYSKVQSAMIGGTALSLKELVNTDFATFKSWQNAQEGNSANQINTGLIYAQGWALCMFLHYYEDGKYRSLLNEFFAAELMGQAGPAKFAEMFFLESDADWTDLDAEYRQFVRIDLRRMGLKSGR